MDSDGYWAGSDEIKITSAKSSNTKFATVKSMGSYLDVTIKSIHKKGSATISWKMNGVSYSHKVYVTYTRPLSKFTVSGKSYLSSFKTNNTVKTSKKFTKKTVKVTAKSGWKIVEYSRITGKMGKCTTKTYSKGVSSISTTIYTTYPGNGIRLILKNTKTGFEQEINFIRAYSGSYSPVG